MIFLNRNLLELKEKRFLKKILKKKNDNPYLCTSETCAKEKCKAVKKEKINLKSSKKDYNETFEDKLGHENNPIISTQDFDKSKLIETINHTDITDKQVEQNIKDNIDVIDNLNDNYKEMLKQKSDLKTKMCFSSPEDFYETIKSRILRYISTNMLASYIPGYIKKIKLIENLHVILNNCKLEHESFRSLFNLRNDKIVKKNLVDMAIKFDKSLKFNQKTCDLFLTEFDSKIFCDFYTGNLVQKIKNLTSYDKKSLFMSEFMKLYKYVFDLPELLALGSLFSFKSHRKSIVLIHLINILADNIINLKDNKVFILCIVYKTFKCFYEGRNFDLFLISDCEFVCGKTHLDRLKFFLWDFESRKRNDLKLRNYHNLDVCCDLRVYFKTILLIYLYQYTLFIKSYNIEAEDFYVFYILFNKVLESNECVLNLFEEYLNTVKMINKKTFR